MANAHQLRRPADNYVVHIVFSDASSIGLVLADVSMAILDIGVKPQMGSSPENK